VWYKVLGNKAEGETGTEAMTERLRGEREIATAACIRE